MSTIILSAASVKLNFSCSASSFRDVVVTVVVVVVDESIAEIVVVEATSVSIMNMSAVVS